MNRFAQRGMFIGLVIGFVLLVGTLGWSLLVTEEPFRNEFIAVWGTLVLFAGFPTSLLVDQLAIHLDGLNQLFLLVYLLFALSVLVNWVLLGLLVSSGISFVRRRLAPVRD